MKFIFAIALVLVTLPFMVSVAATGTNSTDASCKPFCCDAVVPSVRPGGNVGLNCTPSGIDCGFSGQVTACCVCLSPIGARTGTGVGCT